MTIKHLLFRVLAAHSCNASGKAGVSRWLRPLPLAIALVAIGQSGCSDFPGLGTTAKPADYYYASTTTAPAGGDDADESVEALWRDPKFQKQVVAGYGINAEIEPRVTPEELAIIEEISPLLRDNLPKAKARLEQEVLRPDASAIFDDSLGRVCLQMGNFDQARACFQKAVEKRPTFRRAWRMLGIVQSGTGHPDEAITAFTKMIELGGADGFSYGQLGRAYASKEDYQAAEIAFRNALLLDPKNTNWRSALTFCALKQEKFEDAAVLLTVLIENNPGSADLWRLQAQAYMGLKKPLKAAANLEVVDHLGKATPDNLYLLGNIYVSEDLPDNAGHAFLRSLEVDPKQPVARPLLAAENLAGHGAMSQARSLTTRIHKTLEPQMQPADRARLLRLDVRLIMADGGGTEETVKILEEIVKLDPLDGRSMISLGKYYTAQDKPDRAMLWYERAGGIAKYEVESKLLEARVLVGMRRFRDALPLLRRVQEIKPQEAVARYIEQVDGLSRSK